MFATESQTIGVTEAQPYQHSALFGTQITTHS